MPLFVSFLVPFVTAALLIYFFSKDVTVGEWVALIGSSIVFTLLVFFISKAVSQQSTEYLGGYVTEVRHYDAWNELVTKTREVPCGTDKDGNTQYRTETYTEVEDHPEQWGMFTSFGGFEHSISKSTFDYIRTRFASQEEFIDMYRSYYTKDGDAQAYRWNHRKETIVPYTKTHRYRNPFKNSNSIFRYSDISKDSAAKIGLYDYPEIKGFAQSPVIGMQMDGCTYDELHYINSMYGPSYQFRLFILVYPAEKGLEISEMQKGYWHGGNKNEFVVCLGVDGDRKVEWCNAFSWCDAPWLEVGTRTWFAEHDTLDLYEYGKWLEMNVPDKWKRKEFKDFKYVRQSLSPTAKWIVFVLTALFCFGFGLFVVFNEF